MNGSKTDFIMFGHGKQLQKFITSSINIDGDSVNRLHIVKYLGALLDEELTLKQHIQHKCKSAMYGIHRIKSIRSSLTEEAVEILALGTVISHIDYANAIFIGLPQCSIKIKKLQRIHNMAAIVVLGAELNHQCLRKLHWLPVELRIQIKILVLVFKALHNSSPDTK